MKKSRSLFAVWILLIISLLHGSTYGQTTRDYVLIPGDSLSLPEGSSQQFFIMWYDNKGIPYVGVNELGKTIPVWNINGKLDGNPDEGDLSVPPGFEHATYTAPRSLPPHNPVVISVSFQDNDSTKEMTILLCRVYVIAPKNKWYISFTCTSNSHNSKVNPAQEMEEDIDESHATGNASMVVDAPPPDASGYIHFNAPGDNKLENASVSGSSIYHSISILRDIKGTVVEKTIRDYAGQADHQNTGIEFEYDPHDANTNIVNAGISFNVQGTDKFWKWDDDSRSLKMTGTNNHSQNDETGITIGTSNETIKKNKTGFLIDYHASKDTSYTDGMGAKHIEHSGITYHVTISYIQGNNHSPGKKED